MKSEDTVYSSNSNTDLRVGKRRRELMFHESSDSGPLFRRSTIPKVRYYEHMLSNPKP